MRPARVKQEEEADMRVVRNMEERNGDVKQGPLGRKIMRGNRKPRLANQGGGKTFQIRVDCASSTVSVPNSIAAAIRSRDPGERSLPLTVGVSLLQLPAGGSHTSESACNN